MEMRNEHIKSHSELLLAYHTVSANIPSLETLYYNNLCQRLLTELLLPKLQCLLQTETADWNEICVLTKKYPNPAEINLALNQITFLDINCAAGKLLAVLIRTWIQAKSELSLLFYADNRRISHIEIKIENENLLCWDTRDASLCEYYAPNLVKRVTYQHAFTGKTTVVEEGKIKSETQLLQEAIFEEKKRFLLTQVYAASGEAQHVETSLLALECELAQHLYYTLESDYQELVDLPDFSQNIVYANPLQSRLPSDTTWAVFGQKEKDWQNRLALRKKFKEENDPRKQKQFQKQIRDLGQKICDIAIRHDERYIELQKLKAIFHQKYELNSLFDLEESEATNAEKNELQLEIDKISRVLGLDKKALPPLDLAFSFPELADEQGVFQGAEVVLSDIRPEILPNLPKTNQKFHWKNESYHRFIEQILIKAVQPKGYIHFIAPISFLYKYDATEIRTYLLSHMNLQLIAELPKETTAIIATNTLSDSTEIEFFNTSLAERQHIIAKQYILEDPHHVIETKYPQETQTFIHTIEKEGILLPTLGEIIRGIDITQKNLDNSEGIKMLKAKDIAPLHINFQQRYLHTNYPEYIQRQGEFKGKNWVYVAHSNGTIVASISDSSFLFTKEMYGIKLPPTLSKYYVAAWLNSRACRRYISLTWKEVSNQNLLSIIEKIPVKPLTTDKLSEIEEIVKNIVSLQNGGDDGREEWESLEAFLTIQ